MLFTAALASAEGMEEATSTTTSSINGDVKGIAWRAIEGGKALQVLIPSATGEPENLTILPNEVTRVVGKFVSASQDSTGVRVQVEMPTGVQTFVCNDTVWLKGQKDQVVCWTELYSLQGDDIRFVQDWMLLTKADAAHYVTYNEGYVRPNYSPETECPTFPAPVAKKVAKKGKNGDFRISTSKEENLQTKRGKKVKVLRG